jgi:hypothetical protein
MVFVSIRIAKTGPQIIKAYIHVVTVVICGHLGSVMETILRNVLLERMTRIMMGYVRPPLVLREGLMKKAVINLVGMDVWNSIRSAICLAQIMKIMK